MNPNLGFFNGNNMNMNNINNFNGNNISNFNGGNIHGNNLNIFNGNNIYGNNINNIYGNNVNNFIGNNIYGNNINSFNGSNIYGNNINGLNLNGNNFNGINLNPMNLNGINFIGNNITGNNLTSNNIFGNNVINNFNSIDLNKNNLSYLRENNLNINKIKDKNIIRNSTQIKERENSNENNLNNLNNINENRIIENNNSKIQGKNMNIHNSMNGINIAGNNIIGNNGFQDNPYQININQNNLYGNNISQNNLYGNKLGNNLNLNNINSLNNSFQNMNLNDFNNNNISQINLYQNNLPQYNIFTNNNINIKDQNANNIIENQNIIEEVIEMQRFYLTKKNKTYVFRVEKSKTSAAITYEKYEGILDVNDLSEIVQRQFNSINDVYRFLVNIFEKKKVKLKKIKKEESIDIELLVGDQSIGITLGYNEEGTKIINAKLKLLTAEIKKENKSLRKEFNKLARARQRLNDIIQKRNEIIENELKNDIKTLRDKKTHYADIILENENIQILDGLFRGPFAEDEIDNTFEIFYSYDKILCLVYSTEKKSIIAHNLLIYKRMFEIKNAHENYITNFRHYLDESNKRNLIISISGHDNNLKVWNFSNWECLINIQNVNKRGDLDSACILKDDDNLYIVTSNNYENEDEDEKSEPIKIFDFNGNKVKEIEYSDCKTFFVCAYYDDELKINYIITGNEGNVKSYDYNNNKLYHSYYKEDNTEPHISIIVKKYENNTKIIESCWDNYIRLWNFHEGTLIGKINMKKSLRGICLLDDVHLCVACSKKIKIVNIENTKIVKEIEFHNKKVLTIKKIYHPYYKDCLLAQCSKQSGINLLFFENIKSNSEKNTNNIVNKKNNIIKSNNNIIKNNINIINNTNNIINNTNNIINNAENIKDLKTKYYIDKITGDGNCLFYSLSKMIFGNDSYYKAIRQIICDYYENSNVLDNLYETEDDKKEYIAKMRKDKEYGSVLEIQAFSHIFKIRIYQYTRYINDEGGKKNNEDKITKVIIGEQYDGNFGIILDNYKNNEMLNHFQSLRPKNDNIGISDQKLQEIKDKILIDELAEN